MNRPYPGRRRPARHRHGAKLVAAAVEWARAEKASLLPLCPFARSVFDKTPAYADVLAK